MRWIYYQCAHTLGRPDAHLRELDKIHPIYLCDSSSKTNSTQHVVYKYQKIQCIIETCFLYNCFFHTCVCCTATPGRGGTSVTSSAACCFQAARSLCPVVQCKVDRQALLQCPRTGTTLRWSTFRFRPNQSRQLCSKIGQIVHCQVDGSAVVRCIVQ